MLRTRSPGLRRLVCLLAGLLPSFAMAQDAKPARYQATIRYRISADREGRVLQYRAMVATLQKAGFTLAPKENAHLDAFDPNGDRLDGTVTAATARQLLDEPHVQTVLLIPENESLPAEAAAPVQVSITLSAGLFVEQQYQLHSQAVERLNKLGFRENLAYDHQGFTRIRGSIPSRTVGSLTKDLRDLPQGWFVADSARSELPLPLRTMLPVRLVEVLSKAPDTAAALAPVAGKGKLAADAWKVVSDAANKDKPVQLELLLDYLPTGGLNELIDRITLVAPSASLAGFTGQAAVVHVSKAQDGEQLARLPEVRHIRIPRTLTNTAILSASAAAAPAGIEKLHQRGITGRGAKVTIIATGFPGAAALIGKQLPADTQIVDLTMESNPGLDSAAADPRFPGSGTAAALAVRAAAPEAGLILVRVDPTGFHQLISIAKAAGNSGFMTDAMQVRLSELTRQSATLGVRRDAVMAEYTAALRSISDDEKSTKRRDDAKKAYDQLVTDESRFQERFARFLALRKGLNAVATSQVILNTLVAEYGQPHDGLSELNAAIAAKFAPKPQRSAIRAAREPNLPVWIQAAGSAPGSIWAGPFLDADGNGVMEFAAAAPSGQWTPELNFLSQNGQSSLAAGARFRVVVQWREPLDRESATDAAQFPLSLALLRQIDPTGKTASADELTLTARSTDDPIRIFKTNLAAVYEQTLDITIPAAGRYALRVEGRRLATTDVAARQTSFEVTPRIVLDSLDATTGRIGFGSPAIAPMGVGIPGESSSVITIGTKSGQLGAGPGVTLLAKPDLYAGGTVAVNGQTIGGSAASAGHVAGIVAGMSTKGIRPRNLPQSLGLAPGGDLTITDQFLQSLPR